MNKKKIEIDVDKHKWQPSPLIGQIVLVSTIDANGVPNVSPKSWVSMMAFSPPIVVLGCSLNHNTAKNILETKEFVINTVDESMAEACWEISESTDRLESLERHGLTLLPSISVSPPRINESKGHIECTLHSSVRFDEANSDVALFGRIVAVSLDEDAFKDDLESRYSYLSPIVYLEERSYGIVSSFKKVEVGPNI